MYYVASKKFPWPQGMLLIGRGQFSRVNYDGAAIIGVRDKSFAKGRLIANITTTPPLVLTAMLNR